MIKDTTSERIDELIERFETDWSVTSVESIESLMDEADLVDDEEAVTELVRIDIERRYREGLPVPLDDYLSRFELLRGNPQRASEVVFEDHRSRQAFGYPFDPDRWSNIDGVESEPWYREYVEGQSAFRVTFDRSDPVGAETLWRGVDHSVRPAGWSELTQSLLQGLEEIGFRVRELIGTGAFAKVFLATQKSLAYRAVVLKIVQDAWSEPEQLAKLQHTNIVPIYSVHRVKGHTAICMPYAGRWTLEKFMGHTRQLGQRNGHTLVRTLTSEPIETRVDDPSLLDENALELDESALGDGKGHASEERPVDDASPQSKKTDLRPPGLDGGTESKEVNAESGPLGSLRGLSRERLLVWIFRRLAAGLAHSHQRGLLHQDLKPANVLIRDDGEPALLDFNLAVATNRSRQERLGGTPAYMAPEALKRYLGDEEVRVGEPADVYGLGCMMFEFGTGRRPFDANTNPDEDSLEDLLARRQQSVSWRADDQVSFSVRRVIERCLDPNPAERYPSAQQLLEDLTCEESGLSLRHAGQPFVEGTRKRIRRHPRWATGLAVGLLACFAAVPVMTQNRAVKAESELVKSQTKFDRFAEESNQALSAALVNPNRYEGNAVLAALGPLQRFGVLDGTFDEELLNVEGLSNEERSSRRDLALRHVVFVAITESERIEAAHGEDIVDEEELFTVSQLVATANRLTGANGSRSVWQLEADLAGYRGDAETQTHLLERIQATEPQTSDEKYLDAVRNLKDRRFHEASDLLRELEDEPSIPPGSRWTLLGRSEYADREYESAKLAFTSSMRYSQDSARLHFLRGRCYHFAGQFRRATRDYQRALEWEPDFVIARWNLAMSWMELDDYEEAVKTLSRGLELQPNSIPMLSMRSEALFKDQQPKAASNDYQRVLGLEASTYRDFITRGRLRRLREDYEGSIQDLIRAEAIIKTSSEAKYELAASILKSGDLKRAIAKLRESYALLPNSEKTAIDLAVLLARDGQFEEADRLKVKALQDRNQSVVLYQAACVDALKPDLASHQIAMSRLVQALDAGYGEKVMDTDSDIASVRKLPGYQWLRRVLQIKRRVPESTGSANR